MSATTSLIHLLPVEVPSKRSIVTCFRVTTSDDSPAQIMLWLAPLSNMIAIALSLTAPRIQPVRIAVQPEHGSIDRHLIVHDLARDQLVGFPLCTMALLHTLVTPAVSIVARCLARSSAEAAIRLTPAGDTRAIYAPPS